MYVGFTRHNVSKGKSCVGLIKYLDKENKVNNFELNNSDLEFVPVENNLIYEDEEFYYEIKNNLESQRLKLDKDNIQIKEGQVVYSKDKLIDDLRKNNLDIEENIRCVSNQILNNLNESSESFFNQSYDVNDKLPASYSLEDVVSQIDNNKSQQDSTRPNFYTFCISPSKNELKHLEEKAREELKKRGVDPLSVGYDLYIKKLKNEQLKLYTQDVMTVYAKSMNTEVFINQDKLPTDRQRLKMNPIVDDKYIDWKQENGFVVDKKEYLSFDVFENEENNYSFIYEGEERSVFLPDSTFKVENDVLFIEKEFLLDKVKDQEEKASFEKEMFDVGTKDHSVSNIENNDVYCKQQLYIGESPLKGVEGEYNIYFKEAEIEHIEKNIYAVSDINYKLKVYNKNVLEIKKQHPEISKTIYDDLLLKYNYELKDNILYHKKEDKSLVKVNENDLKRFNSILTVEVNKFIDTKYNLNNPTETKITDWNTQIDVSCDKDYKVELLKETEKAIFLSVTYKDKEYKYWSPKSANEIEYYDLYGNLIKQEELETFKGEKTLYVSAINKETFDNKLALDKKMNLRDFKIELKEKPNLLKKEQEGDYYIIRDNNFLIYVDKKQIDKGDITNKDYDLLRRNAFLDANKQLYKEQYEKILGELKQKNKDLESNAINHLCNKEFTQFLISQGIHLDKKYQSVDKLEKEKGKWKITTNAQQYGYDKQIIFYIGEKDIHKDKIFVSDDRFEKLLNKAIDRDKKDNEPISLANLDPAQETIKTQKGEVKLFVVNLEIEGLKEPIKLSFKEEQVVDNQVPRYIYEREFNRAIEAGIKKEFGNIRQEIKLKVWEEHGFDVSKRELTVDDLLYFAKVEEKRTYNQNDKEVITNEQISKDIEELKKQGKSKRTIRLLENGYVRHTGRGDIIKRGDIKEGDNTHVHVVLSRSDKYSENPKDKVGVSPLVTRKGNNNNDGIDRTQFFKDIEQRFDIMFNYQRPQYEKFTHRNNLSKQAMSSVLGQLKYQILNDTGISDIKRELNIKAQIKHDLLGGVPLPTVNPVKLAVMIKNPIRLGLEIVKLMTRL